MNLRTPDLARNILAVSLHHLTQAAHDQGIEHLLTELNATQTIFPGTRLTLVFKIGSSRFHPKQEFWGSPKCQVRVYPAHACQACQKHGRVDSMGP